jgi:raffinose/stachyose/melibiose transport system permease protein
VRTFILSFYQWDGITPATWNGWENYATVLNDPYVRGAFLHSFVLVVFYSLFPVAIGLVLASALVRVVRHGSAVFRTILFLPQTIALVVVAIAWRWIYAPEGAINEVLRLAGLGDLARAWLGDFTFALPALGVVGTWVMYGFPMLIFIAGMQRIPQSLYDAARIDGCGPVREFFHVTLPSLRHEIALALTLTFIAAFRVFDLVYISTRGGPGSETNVPALEIYGHAFERYEVGQAAAIGVLLTLTVLVAALVISRIFREERT